MRPSQIKTFSSPQFGDIRVAMKNGTPLFSAQDLGRAIGLAAPIKSSRIREEDRFYLTNPKTGRRMLFFNYNGMRDALLESLKGNANLVFQWLSQDVYPTLTRKKEGPVLPEVVPILEKEELRPPKVKMAEELLSLVDKLDGVIESVEVSLRGVTSSCISTDMHLLFTSIQQSKSAVLDLLKDAVMDIPNVGQRLSAAV